MFSVIELATRHPALRVERSRRQCDGSDGSLGKVFQSLGEGTSSLRRPWSSQQQQRSRYAAAVKSHAAAGEWPRARMHVAHAPQRRHKTTAQLSKWELAAAAAATSPPPLLLCCCCCAAASAAPRSAMHRGARSAMLIRDAYTESPEKNVPLQCSISFIWRSGVTRGAGTKNSKFTLPQRVEEGETSRDTGGNIVHRVERRVPAKKSQRKV